MSNDWATAPRYRFAPSPTGFFHVGGARTALYNWALAKQSGGRFVLRIEDTDEARNKPEWTTGIIDALAWIGIESSDPTFEGPYFQSAYADAHVAAAQRLVESGDAYYCDLTAEQIQERAKANGNCWRTSSTTSKWASPTWCAPRSTFRTPRSSRCCGARSVTTRRCGRTFPCS